MSRVLMRSRSFSILATVAVTMTAGCAKATQSQLLPANESLAPVRVRGASAVESVVYSFAGGSGSSADGAGPWAGLIDLNGTLYSTTTGGGAYGLDHDHGGFGTVYSITPYGTEMVLHRFKGADGKYPIGGLIDVNGTLYGTTKTGGGHTNGTVFSITPYGTEAVLHSFKSGKYDGKYPEAGLLKVNGTLYGTTLEGGAYGGGTVFSITTTGKETVLHSFGRAGDGYGPYAGLINVKGTLYGTTYYQAASGSTYGTVFSITTAGKETVLHSFKGGAADGAGPTASLLSVNGTLYGTTTTGGAHDDGTVFSITTTGRETILHSFGCASGSTCDGAYPCAGLIDVNGTLYGTTVRGGDGNGGGTVFSITTSGTEAVLHNFILRESSTDGSGPHAALLNVKGALYGTTEGGGDYGLGTVYSLTGF